MKKHRATVLLLIAFFLVSIHFAEAQQRKAVFRVGVLEPGFRRPEATAPSACNSGFREGLRELGWIEGQNLRIEQRHGEFKPDQLQRFAAELVRISPKVCPTHRLLYLRLSRPQPVFPSSLALRPMSLSRA